MPDTLTPAAEPLLAWPEGLTRVPFRAYRDAAVYEAEQTRLFEGATCEFSLPGSGDRQRRRLAHDVRRPHAGGGRAR